MLQLSGKLIKNLHSSANEVWSHSDTGYNSRIKRILSLISRAKDTLQMLFGVGEEFLAQGPSPISCLDAELGQPLLQKWQEP